MSRSLQERIIHALAHPVRVRLLRLISAGPHSAASAARLLGLPRENVAYHLGQLAEPCEVVELAQTRPVGKTREHVYQLRPRSELVDIATDLPPGISAALHASLASRFFDALKAALVSGHTDRHGTQLSAGALLLDSEGWEAAATIVRAADARLKSVEMESRRRLAAASWQNRIFAMTGLALFQTAPNGSTA